ncbi:TonB-dependent receptor, partial [Reichenbachiella sp.]
LANSTSGQKSVSVREVYIDVQLKNASVEEAFTSIESKTDYKFNYEHLAIGEANRLSIKKRNVSVADVLIEISKKSQLSFKQVNKSINVDRLKETNEPAVKVIDEDITVSGKVTDENGQGLPGATVIAKGTTIGATSDFDGNFKVNVPDDAVLVISFIGYLSQEIAIGGRSVIDVQMEVDAQKLEEVVVVGYGTQKRANVTGAIAGVSSKNFEDFPVTSFDQGLAGQVAGVNVSQGTGSPGSAPNITIRGTGTITAGTGPLLVIDGFPTDNINLSDINPNDIESVQILKDAAAASIYGSRASNGVLMVTTKRGESDKLRINFNTYHGVQQVAKTYDLANAYEWAEFQTENYLTNGTFSSSADIPPLYQQYINGTPGLVDTDWQDEIFRDAAIHSYQLSLSGGNKKTSFYVSGEFFDQEGVIVSSDFKRYSLRANVTSKLLEAPDASFLKGVKLGVNLVPTFTSSERVSESHHNNDGIVITGVFAYPNFAARNADGSLNISEQIIFGQAPIGQGLNNNGARFENPLAVAIERENPVERARLLGNTFLDFELIEGLNFKTSLGFNYASERDRMFRPSTIGRRRDPVPVTAIAWNNTERVLNWANENTLTYTKTFNENHNFSFLAGHSIQKENIQRNNIAGQGFSTNDTPTLNSAASITGAGSEEEEWALLSYLGRVTYDFNGKYLVSASIRRDGSSRFGSSTKWGTFPSASVGWRVSEESFFSGLENAVSDLKLRASYGRTGNNQIPNYGAIALLNSANYSLGGTVSNGLAAATSPNENLSWETTDQVDLGVDLGFFGDRLTLTADYYKSTTKGLLLEVPVPSHSGYETSLQNLGRVRNTGFELIVSANKVQLGPVEWSSSFNISTNKNEVLELGPGQEQIASKFHITEVGQELGRFYGWNSLGIYDTQEQVDASAHESGAAPGDYIWEDVNSDGVIDDDDRKVLGSALPDFTYGFSSNFKFKGIDLGFLLQGSQGADRYNFTSFFLTLEGGFSNALAERVNERWRSPSQPGNGKWGRAGSTQTNFDRSNLHVEDASYLRVRNITLGYTFPKELTKKVRIEKARVYFSSINPFTFTDYSGFNPEVTSTIGSNGSPLEPGIDWGNYPTARSFTVGVNLTF